MLTKIRSPAICAERRATGRFTSTPRWIIGAVIMKMISSTSITSTSGTTLISASEVLTRRPRPRRPLLAAADGWTFGILGEIPLGDVQELHRKVVHLRGKVLHAIR